MRTVTQLASCAVLVAAIAGPLPAAGSTTDLTIGDTLELEYAYPNVTTIFDTTGTFTYTGPGQTALINSGITELDILSNNQIEFLECGVDNGDCSQTAASYNGPLLIDLTNSNAFSDWGIQSSNANGIVSLFLASGEIGVNWQDVGVGLLLLVRWCLARLLLHRFPPLSRSSPLARRLRSARLAQEAEERYRSLICPTSIN